MKKLIFDFDAYGEKDLNLSKEEKEGNGDALLNDQVSKKSYTKRRKNNKSKGNLLLDVQVCVSNLNEKLTSETIKSKVLGHYKIKQIFHFGDFKVEKNNGGFLKNFGQRIKN